MALLSILVKNTLITHPKNNLQKELGVIIGSSDQANELTGSCSEKRKQTHD